LTRARHNPPIPFGEGVWGLLCLVCGTRWRWFEHYVRHAREVHAISVRMMEAGSVEGSSGVGYFWTLEHGQPVLMAQPMLVGGERIRPEEAVSLREQDARGHLVSPEQVEGTPALCDFCQGRPIHAVWPALRSLVEGRSMGSAALDRPCYQALRNRNMMAIVERMQAVLRRRYRLIPRAVSENLRALVEEWMANAEAAGLPPILLPH
jgi:hypothetical protein